MRILDDSHAKDTQTEIWKKGLPIQNEIESICDSISFWLGNSYPVDQSMYHREQWWIKDFDSGGGA